MTNYQPPQPEYPPPPPQKKRRTWLWVLGGLTALCLLGMGACVALIGGVANQVDKETKRQVAITYQVEGTGPSASITYSGNDLNISQDTEAALPWTKSVTIDGLAKTATLSAQNAGGGSVTCRILADGKQIAEQTANGSYAIASCTGDAGS